MADDGGRVPDVSEQRAEDRYDALAADEAERLRAGIRGSVLMEALTDAETELAELRAARDDPASVLAALLAESPDATVAAIEALLTSDEAVEDAHAILYRQFAGPRTRDTVRHAFAAACRSLLSKAPKEDGDA